MGANSFTPSITLNPLAMLAPDARSTPPAADRKQSAYYQAVIESDVSSGWGSSYGGGWGGDRYQQVAHFRGVVAVAIRAWLDALSACKFTLYRRKKQTVKKSASGQGNYARDDEYEPLTADEHPLAKVLEEPDGPDGVWSIQQECAYLALQFLLTGDAPAWLPVNGAGKPVRFFALTSAMTQMIYQPGTNPQYPKGAYRVTPYNGGGAFFVGGQMGSYAVLPGEEVARLRDYNPWSRTLGMSRLQTNDREVDVLEAITQSRWAMFDHGTQLDAALLLPGLDAEAGKAVQEAIERKHGGARHARRFMVLAGAALDAKWDLKTFGQSSREMDFTTSYDQAAGVVLSLFGVPKQNANFNTESNYAQDWAAQQKFYDLTLSPFCRGKLSDFLTQALARKWEERRGELKIECEPQVPKNLETEAKEREFAATQGFISHNEYRIATGRKPDPDGDVPQSVYIQKLTPQPDPMGMGGVPGDPMGGDPMAGDGAPVGGQQPGDDGPEATQDAVTQAALSALGLGGQTVGKGFDPNEARDESGKWTEVGSGNTGKVYSDGSEVVKSGRHPDGRETREGEFYKELAGVVGVAPGRKDGDTIRLPHYQEVLSVDTVPDARDRESMGTEVGKNRNRLLNAANAMGEAGIDYNDPLQVGFDDDYNAHVIDLSNAGKVKPAVALRANIERVARFMKDFGAERTGDSILRAFGILNRAQLFRSPEDARQRIEGRAKVGDRSAKHLLDMGPEKVAAAGAKYVYYATNPRPILRDVLQSEPDEDGVKYILSATPLDADTIRQYSLTPVVHPPQRESGKQMKALAPPTKPGGVARVVRPEGSVWTGRDGQRYTKRNGKILPVANPTGRPGASPAPQQQRPAATPTATPVAQPVDPQQSAANIDALAKRLLGGRDSVRMIVTRGPSLPAKEHIVTDGASLKRYLDAGGKLHPEYFAKPAQSVPVATPAARQTVAAADQWAARQADRHADRVAAHFGISREKAHALLTHAIQMVARHAAQGGQAAGVTIRDPRSGKTARLAPKGGGVPRPANPAAQGSRPPMAKAMNTMAGSAGGFLVEPEALPRRRKGSRAGAVLARVLQRMEDRR
jgi:hypothetical protein